MDIDTYLKKIRRDISEIKTIERKDAIKAVEQDGYALRYVKDQTQDICIKAVEQDGYALQWFDISVFKPEKIEMTIENIEKELGYEIKIVK